LNISILKYWNNAECQNKTNKFFSFGSNAAEPWFKSLFSFKKLDKKQINYSQKANIELPSKRFLVIIYNSFGDPLFQNLILAYIKTQSRSHPHYRFDILTFEQKDYALNSVDMEKTKIILQEDRIFWHPLRYHNGRFLLLKKLYDFGIAGKEVFLIRLKGKPAYIISFANVAAAIGIVLSKIFRTKHLIYSYEPHADFLVDFGIWKKHGLRYKIMSKLERYAGIKSDVILTGTDAMKQELERQHSRAKIYRAPSGVDENVFKRNEIARLEIRQNLKIENRKVIIYVGKFGGIYYDREIVEFFKGLLRIDPEYFFLILSPSDHQIIHNHFDSCGIENSNFHITRAYSAEEVARWNSTADVGLSAIPPLPHQQFRSPVKVGEYLLCGLPYITCKGVSEDAEYALQYGVGAVVEELSEKSAIVAHEQLNTLFKMGPSELSERCRKIGEEYRGKSNVDRILDKVLAE